MAIHQHWMYHQHTFHPVSPKIVPIATLTKKNNDTKEDVTIDIPKETINDKHIIIQPQQITVTSHQLRSSHPPLPHETSLPRRIHFLTTCLTLLLPLHYVVFSSYFYGTDTISWILQGIDASSSTIRNGIIAGAALNIIYVSVDVTFIAITNHGTPHYIRLTYIVIAILLSISCMLAWMIEIIINKRFPAGIYSLILGCSAIFVVCILSISISILSHLLSSVSSHMDETSRIRCHTRVQRLHQNLRYAWCAAMIAILGCIYVTYESFQDIDATWIRMEKKSMMYDLPDYFQCILCLWLRWYFWVKKPMTTVTITTGT